MWGGVGEKGAGGGVEVGGASGSFGSFGVGMMMIAAEVVVITGVLLGRPLEKGPSIANLAEAALVAPVISSSSVRSGSEVERGGR